ncbi:MULTISPECIES: cold-shock protein [Priestia]|mgnify:CR=1 FL=1|jgi:hypothetical protein|uniref:Cold-shock protein n=3 Tax=Priestia TaxID=2800373 RepID=A0A0H4KI63_9BACI|nr:MULTISPECIES: cold-shock protein [Priestia]AKO93295.1 cold-shock protein [Priestia filamentosa]KAB2491672.1 cold-shock protein [Priestia endophytica]KYG34242.1 cold-shock protein [Priestia endophytica]MBG9813128.1 cold-shock protein [Priestia endophytica]MCM3538590.1 cold-shock protein [Priestia endophytica]
MYNKKEVPEIVTAETKVWNCVSEDCNCWVRDNFKSSETPTCPLCESEMKSGVEILQVVDNPTLS